MKSFKTFLTEYLTDEQRSRYSNVHISDEAKRHTDHFFGPNNNEVREDVIGLKPEKSEIHKAIERHLGKEISHEDYQKNLTKDQYGRDIRLARLIRDDKLRNQFANDNARAGTKKTSGHYMTIVRGTEVAGQTNSAPDPLHPKGHSWEGQSCKNVDTGCNNHYLKSEIEHGTVVVRAHDHTGQEIYRATLQPHDNYNGDRAYALDSEYGLKHPAFTAHAHDVARRLSKDIKIDPTNEDQALFYKHDDVYDDSGERSMLHPSMTNKDLHTIFDTYTSGGAVLRLAAAHPSADHELLHKALDHNHVSVKKAAAANPNVSSDHLHKAIESGHYSVQLNAISNPKLRSEHIDKVISLNDPDLMASLETHPELQRHHVDKIIHQNNDSYLHYTFLNNKHITSEHLDKMLADNKSKFPANGINMGIAAHPKATESHLEELLKPEYGMEVNHEASENKNMTERLAMKTLTTHDDKEIRANTALNTKHHSVIDKAIDSGNEDLKYEVAANPNVTSEHLHALLNPENSFHIKRRAMFNPNITAEHLNRGISDPNPTVREAVASNPKANDEHLHKALNDEAVFVREAAAANPNAKPEHLEKALNDYGDEESFRVRRKAAVNPNITKPLLKKALNDENLSVWNYAKRNPNFTKLMGY